MKSTRSFRLLAILTLVVTAGLAGCDGAGTPDAITGVPEYNFAVSGQPITNLVLTSGSPTTTTVSVLIGSKGGRIVNGEHTLVIPKQAVRENTYFTFQVGSGSYLQVDLTARRASDGMEVNTFPKPLTLTLSYRGVQVSDPQRLVIAWLVDGTTSGQLQALPTAVDKKNQTVRAPLTHFSGYIVGTN